MSGKLVFNPGNNATHRRYFYQFQNYLKSGKNFENYVKCLDRKELSKFKSSIKLINIKDKDRYIDICSKYQKRAKKYKKKKENQLYVKKLELKINRINSKRVKLGFRLQEISGLRIAELEKLTQKDIMIDLKNKKLNINVINGKYGRDRVINCFWDDWIIEQLIKLKPKKNKHLFCTKEYMMKKANDNNFHTHDLRKIFAQTFYYNCVEDEEKTLEMLAQNMGHGDIKETYVYLNRDMNTYKSKMEKVKPFTKNDLT
jgi:integrase